MAETCGICEETVGSLFEHLRIDHKIKSAEEYQTALAKAEAGRAHKKSFGAFVEELNAKQTKGLITGEEWRRLVKEWLKEHPT